MRLIALLVLILALAGCGQKGALFLPEEPPPAAENGAENESDEDADEDDGDRRP